MKPRNKRWSELTTEELAAATREFDDPNYQPVARIPSKRQLAQLHRVRRKSAESRFRIALLLQKDVVEFTDNYAANHGVTFSDVVDSALRQLKKKSA
jgi:hypothetical protein